MQFEEQEPSPPNPCMCTGPPAVTLKHVTVLTCAPAPQTRTSPVD